MKRVIFKLLLLCSIIASGQVLLADCCSGTSCTSSCGMFCDDRVYCKYCGRNPCICDDSDSEDQLKKRKKNRFIFQLVKIKTSERQNFLKEDVPR